MLSRPHSKATTLVFRPLYLSSHLVFKPTLAEAFSTSMSGIKTVFGGGGLKPGPEEDATVQYILKLLKAHDVKNIDTAQLYAGSEALLGAAAACQYFIVDTKWPGGYIPGTSKKDDIIQRAEASLESLKTDQVLPQHQSHPSTM